MIWLPRVSKKNNKCTHYGTVLNFHKLRINLGKLRSSIRFRTSLPCIRMRWWTCASCWLNKQTNTLQSIVASAFIFISEATHLRGQLLAEKWKMLSHRRPSLVKVRNAAGRLAKNPKSWQESKQTKSNANCEPKNTPKTDLANTAAACAGGLCSFTWRRACTQIIKILKAVALLFSFSPYTSYTSPYVSLFLSTSLHISPHLSTSLYLYLSLSLY